MVDRACAEENIFFSLCCRIQKKEARVGEYDAFFFEREFFHECVDRLDDSPKTREQRALFRAPKDFVCALSPLEKRPHVFVCFLFLLFFIVPISGTQNTKNSKKKSSNTLFSVLLLTHLSAQTDATRASLQPRTTTTINKRSLCFWGNRTRRRRRRRRTLHTHTQRE